MTERQYLENVIDRLHRHNEELDPASKHFLPLLYRKRDLIVWELHFETNDILQTLDELSAEDKRAITEENRKWVAYQMHEGELKRIQGVVASGEMLSTLVGEFIRFQSFGQLSGTIDDNEIALDKQRGAEKEKLLQVKSGFMEAA